jgi:hypothetical protein
MAINMLPPDAMAGLRRAQAAQAGGYGSIASRADPNNYGSILSRKYPGLFGQDAQPTGRDAMNAQTDEVIKNNQRTLTLRGQQAALQQNPEDELALKRLQLQLGLRRSQQGLNSFGTNIFAGGADDGSDDPLAY